MFRSMPGLALAAGLLVAASAAVAQPASSTTTPPASPAQAKASGGLGPTITNPTEIDKGQNMIVPNAGVSHPSAAPTMVYDCKNKPQDCTTPINPGDKADLPDTSATPPTSKP
ncbi:hypothetical protein [Bosea sp. (in: a-proteobacteria)]|jgi:hypothetical protein|uniref:hypothetical protein n=1 Tax=Bosea sp. (in: a-proteobacteria) TaxID=1871050 RepID=UPI002735F127|nr:hypothetical protein [Bosea sp. (in: a-proteobacteria)]MDP3409648.1 hypothetical protein [Bosea sp. (in: a-proteobacteria)]